MHKTLQILGFRYRDWWGCNVTARMEFSTWNFWLAMRSLREEVSASGMRERNSTVEALRL